MANQKFFAFWKYDQFPFVLGAEVVKMHDSGSIEAKGYQGMRFMPIKLLPLEAGKALYEKIHEVAARYEAAIAGVKLSHLNEVDKLLDGKVKR